MVLRICYLVCAVLSLSAGQPSTVGPANLPTVYIPLCAARPFSASAITEATKLQWDGTPTFVRTIFTIARDSKGRTRAENLGVITISDPITHTQTLLDPPAKRATVYPFPKLLQQRSASVPDEVTPDSEDLGVSAIEGLSVHGYRNKETIRLSNQRPITFWQEGWYSEQMQMSIKTKTGDSRGESQSFTITQLNLNEPEAALFQLPAEYNVSDVRTAVPVPAAVAEANLINHVDPQYPPLAKAARIQDTIEFIATIGSDGLVKDLQLVRGHPILVNAAKDAILQWRYRPILLNGYAIVATAPVKVTFTVSDRN
jgi:hypothetical protein